jgi:hypothetical protein
MRSVLFTARLASLALLAAYLCALSGCNKYGEKNQTAEAEDGANGTYYAAPNKLFEREQVFDVRWKVTHAPMTNTFDPAINIDNRQLAINRCTNCHDGGCGFNAAFDLENYNKPGWKPKIKGQDWAAPAIRMIPKNNSFLNDVIVERIYTFLRDETTIGYDESKDTRGAVTVEVDEQGTPVKHERAKTPQKGKGL